MPSCSSCGGDNPPQATRCEYCDQPMTGEKLVEVAWSARTNEGASGEGRIRVAAPTHADLDRVRAIVEAAFSASVDAVGTQATAETVQEEMARRLPTLLPADHPLASVEVSAFEAFVLVAGKAGAGGARPAATSQGPGQARSSGGGKVVMTLGLLLLGFCCLSCGGFSLVVSSDDQKAAKQVRRAQLPAPEEAAQASGLVCLEGVTAQVGSAVVVRPGRESAGAAGTAGSVEAEQAQPVPCLYVSTKIETVTKTTRETKRADGTTRTSTSTRTKRDAKTQSVESFRVGDLVVELGENHSLHKVVEPQSLGDRVEGNVTYRYSGIRADQPVTLVGIAKGGVLRGLPGQPLVLSNFATRAALLETLDSKAKVAAVFGFGTLIFGALLVLIALVSFVRR